MALARCFAIALLGVEGHVVEVEADLAQGLPKTVLTGLPDTSLGEARDRVRAAITNSGAAWPMARITLGLSPASLPKRGSGFDLALACAVLAAQQTIPRMPAGEVVMVGELGLDGSVRGVRGVLPSVVTALRAGFTTVVVPAANLAEARLVPDIDTVGVASLTELRAYLEHGTRPLEHLEPAASLSAPESLSCGDMSEVAGQVLGRTAMEVVAAGGHHALLLGPPGSGKTMCATRLPSLLPELCLEDALDVTAIHSVAGVLPPDHPLVRRPPFQAPHHGATAPALVGGGSGLARPGAVSLAHHGVLFLDEAPEFGPGALDALRQPLESGSVTVTRVGGSATYPARFTLVLAANPCPCGGSGSAIGNRTASGTGDGVCTCPPERRRRYLARLSGPLLDRVDLHVEVPAITRAEILSEGGLGESSAAIAERVVAARARAAERFAGTPYRLNGQVPVTLLRQRWPLTPSALHHLGAAMDKGSLTARGFGRVLRMAWTLSDLCDAGEPGPEHVAMALGYRLGGLGRSAA